MNEETNPKNVLRKSAISASSLPKNPPPHPSAEAAYSSAESATAIAPNPQMAGPGVGLFCPNCGAALEGRKCKLFCHTPGCGYLVTCSEW